MTTNAAPKRKPFTLGGYEPTPDADLEALAEISPSDIERARQEWQDGAPPELAGLLDAAPIDYVPKG